MGGPPLPEPALTPIGATPVPSCDLRGKQLYNFALAGLDGQPWEYKRNRLPGTKVMLLDFWGTWCVPCRLTIKSHLNRLNDWYGRQGLEIIGIAYEQEPTYAAQVRTVEVARRELGINYRLLMGAGMPTCPVKRDFDIKGFPTLVLLNDKGQIIWSKEGMPTEPEFEQLKVGDPQTTRDSLSGLASRRACPGGMNLPAREGQRTWCESGAGARGMSSGRISGSGVRLRRGLERLGQQRRHLQPDRLGERHRIVARLQQFVVILGRAGRRSRGRQLALHQVGLRLRSRVVPGHLVAVIADRQFVAVPQFSFLHAHPVDADAVGAIEVAHHQVVGNLGDAAVAARNLARIDLDVAFGVAAEQQDRLVQHDAGAVSQGQELRRHRRYLPPRRKEGNDVAAIV